MNMTHGSLFSGIGGFDLAAKRVGWQNIFAVEKDKWCRELLNLRFPTSQIFQDIKDFSGHEFYGKIDVISGGFPCQPFSVAGKQKGKSDDRYLWKEMLRIIQEIRPTWVVGENVAGIIKLALDEVLSDLEDCGYSTETFIIPACSVGAPHRRDRIWIVAHSGSQRAGSDSRAISDKRREPCKSRGTSLRQGYGEIGASGINSTSEDAAYSDEYCKSNCTEHDRTVEFSQNPGYKNGSRSNEQGETPQADRTEITNESKFSISRNTQRINSHTTGKRCNNGCNNGKKRSIHDDQGIAEENQSERSQREYRIGEIDELVTDTKGERLQFSRASWQGGDGFTDSPNKKSTTNTTIDRLETTWEPERQMCTEPDKEEETSDVVNEFYGNSNGIRWQGQRSKFNEKRSIRLPDRENSGWRTLEWPTEPPLCGANDGISRRVDRLKGLGNAIVPQVAMQIFEAINIIHNS